MKPAERSSWCTWTAIRGSSARARASGVEREPGHTTASSTPPAPTRRRAWRRTSRRRRRSRSSTQGRARPCDAGARAARGGVRGGSRGSCCCTASPRPQGPGDRSPTPSRADHEVVARRPAGPRRLGRRPGRAVGDGRAGRRGRRPGDLRRLLDGRPGGPARRPGQPRGRRAARARRAPPPASTTPTERAERRASDEALAERLEQIGVDAFLDEWLAQPLFAELPAEAAGPRGPPHEHRGRAGRQSCGRRAPARWTRRCGTAWPSSRCRCWSWPARRDAKFRRLGARLVRSIGDNAELIVVGDAGHAVHLEQPEAFIDAIRRWFDAVDDVRRRRPAGAAQPGATGQAEMARPAAKRTPKTSCTRPVAAEHRDERAAAGAAQHRGDRLLGEHDGDERERAGRPAAEAGHERHGDERRRRAARRRGAGSARRPGAPPACACPTAVSPGMSRRLLTTSSAVGEEARPAPTRRAPAP